jgi:hypothetical protein
VQSRFLQVVLSSVILAGALGLAACGGGQGQEVTPTEEVGPPTETAQAGPAELPAVDPNVPLVEYQSPDRGYSISYPQGWQVDVEPGFADYFLWSTEGGRPLAQLAVTCNEDALTPDELISVDSAAASLFGAIDPTSIVPIDIAGTTGKQMRYTVQAGSVAVEQVVAYAPGEKCGWRLGLASYGAGTLASYLPLFQRIIESFRPG